MYAIDVGTQIRAPIERVWEFLSDQEGYTFASVVSKATLLRKGHSERDGVGAVVRVRALGAPVTWEIVAFEPPARLEYRITKVLLPMRHEIGAVEFTTRGDVTDVRWTSDFHAAKKRGKDPKKYVLRTLALGVIALIPLLRSEPENNE